MPEFKDISTFNSVVPVGTEKIQVSAANCVTLMEIANLGSKTEWYSNLDKRITQNREDMLANYELANQANNKAVEAMSDAQSALNGVSAVRSQIFSISNVYKALSSYYNITSTITTVTLVGNNVNFINNTSIKTIILNIDQWGANQGSLQDSVIYIPRRNGVGGIVEWSTPNKVSGIYGNLTEVEMMVSSLNNCWVRYQINVVKDKNGSGMTGYELVIIGDVLLPNPNKEVTNVIHIHYEKIN
jgi:hypothetical protein